MMARGLYRKVIKTEFVGQCTCGGRWSEKVRSTKSANKALRKVKKI